MQEAATLTVFKEETKVNQVILAFQEKYQNKEAVLIHKQRWQKQGMPEICQSLKEWRADKLWARQNDEQTILKQIQNINFSCLTFLSVWENNINSIEGLSRIMMPALQNLVLEDNNLTNIEALRKCKFSNLLTLNIKNNPLMNCSCLTELQISLKFSGIILNFQYFSWLMKIEAKTMKFFRTYLHSNPENEYQNKISIWSTHLTLCRIQKKYPNTNFS